MVTWRSRGQCNQIIKLQQTSPDGYLLRAATAINRSQFPRAEQDIRKAMNVAPQSTAPLVQMGNLIWSRKITLKQESGISKGWTAIPIQPMH